MTPLEIMIAAGFSEVDAVRAIDPTLREGGARQEDYLHATAQLAHATEVLRDRTVQVWPEQIYRRPYTGGCRDGSLAMSGSCHVCGELTIAEYAVSNAAEVDRIAKDEWRWKPACDMHRPDQSALRLDADGGLPAYGRCSRCSKSFGHRPPCEGENQ